MTPERVEFYANQALQQSGYDGPPYSDFERAITQAVNEALEEAAKASLDIYGGRGHSYSSENADIYRAQDHALASCAKAIRALKLPEEP